MQSSSLPYRLIGMVHLLPLPAAPGYAGSMESIIARAVADARALADAGFDAVLVENYGDTPFRKERVDPATIAAVTAVVQRVRDAVPVAVGVQVLRNDAQSALSIAAVTGAHFIRVNVHTGAMLADQGIIEGRADETLRLRAALGCNVHILADVFVKHAQPLAQTGIEQTAMDTAARGHADGIIVSGTGTGVAVDAEEVRRVRTAVRVPVFIGSGADISTVAGLLQIADGIIAGTALKTGGVTTAPVDPVKAAQFVKAAQLS